MSRAPEVVPRVTPFAANAIVVSVIVGPDAVLPAVTRTPLVTPVIVAPVTAAPALVPKFTPVALPDTESRVSCTPAAAAPSVTAVVPVKPSGFATTTSVSTAPAELTVTCTWLFAAAATEVCDIVRPPPVTVSRPYSGVLDAAAMVVSAGTCRMVANRYPAALGTRSTRPPVVSACCSVTFTAGSGPPPVQAIRAASEVVGGSARIDTSSLVASSDAASVDVGSAGAAGGAAPGSAPSGSAASASAPSGVGGADDPSVSIGGAVGSVVFPGSVAAGCSAGVSPPSGTSVGGPIGVSSAAGGSAGGSAAPGVV